MTTVEPVLIVGRHMVLRNNVQNMHSRSHK